MVPFKSALKADPDANATFPVLRIPVAVEPYEAPGEMFPEAATVPPTVPLVVVVPPPNVAPALTVTALAALKEPFTSKVPAVTFVGLV